MAMRGLMGRSERSGEGAPEPGNGMPGSVSPSAPAVRTVAPSTSVDASSEVRGAIRCRETLRIDGRVEGEIACEKAVLVGEGAKVEARIEADEVRISGVVEGDIVAGRKITLERTAVVTGDVTTPGIVIEEGAKRKGRIVIGSDAPAADAEPAKQAKANAAPRKAKEEEGGEPARSPRPASAVA